MPSSSRVMKMGVKVGWLVYGLRFPKFVGWALLIGAWVPIGINMVQHFTTSMKANRFRYIKYICKFNITLKNSKFSQINHLLPYFEDWGNFKCVLPAHSRMRYNLIQSHRFQQYPIHISSTNLSLSNEMYKNR